MCPGALQDELIEQTAAPPMYLKTDLLSFELGQLRSEFDVILVEPPLEEYQRTLGVTNERFWSWDEVRPTGAGGVVVAWVRWGSGSGIVRAESFTPSA